MPSKVCKKSSIRASVWTAVLIALLPAAAAAGLMKNDPKGFGNIAWGTSLAARSDLAVARTGPNVTEYEFRGLAPSFGGVPVQSVRLSTVDEQFARVTIRYQGEETHKRILAYLEREYGPVERLPGQMMRGLNQQYNWRGSDSEINVTYQASTERGFLFIDSRTLAPRFNDNIADTAD
jgi:hypothetical protein